MNIRQELGMLARFWSVRLAALAGLAAAYIISHPTVVTDLVGYVPEQWRPLATFLVGFFVFALPTLARRLPQHNLKDK